MEKEKRWEGSKGSIRQPGVSREPYESVAREEGNGKSLRKQEHKDS